jgi:outer membrane receptor protein involved in Fe transport
MSVEEIMNIEITTAGKKTERIADIPASVVVVTRDDIEKYGYQSLTDVLENISGLYYGTDYIAESFGVRGFWTSDGMRNAIIMVNDIPQTVLMTENNIFYMVNTPVEAIDRIEVIRGPMSVIYGPGAFFGVINIFTNKIYDNKPFSLVSVGVGSVETKKVTARISDMSENGEFRYTFNASYYYTYGIDVSYEKLGTVGHSVSTTGGQLENTEKYFNFSGLFKGFSLDASYSKTNNGSIFLLPSLSDGTRMVHNKTNIFFGYEKEFSDKFRADARFGYIKDDWTFEFDWLLDNFYGRQHNGGSGYKMELNMFFDPSPKLNITAGISYLKVADLVSEYTVPALGFNLIHHTLADDEAKVNQSIYAQANYTLSDKFKIVVGARLEQVPEYTLQKLAGDVDTGTYSTNYLTYDNTKIGFIPRLAFIYQPHEDHVLKFLYGKAINHPSFAQNSQNYVEGVALVPILESEYIETFELNYIATLSSKFTVNMSLFRNMLDNLIYRTLYTGGGSVTSYFSNVGEMTTNGVEMIIQAVPVEKLLLELSGTYQDTKDEKHKGIAPGYSPKFLSYLKASYFFNDNISLAATGNYIDEMESYYDDTMNPPDRIGDKVDSYFTLGANLRMRNLFGTGLFLNIRSSNLLDKEIRYPTTSNNNLFAPKGTIGLSRSFLVTAGWKF